MSQASQKKEGLAAWLPIIGLAFAAFVFNTSEFVPVGLLPDIAADLGETISFTGLMITGYAWIVAVMSLPLTVLTAKLERRRLLLMLLAFFAVCHFAALWIDNFAALMSSRVGVALTHSIFWSIMTPLAARMAPLGKRAVGLAAVMGGTIIATVLGVPIGTQLGHMFGWQETFFLIGVMASAVWLLIYKTLPVCKSTRAGSLRSLPDLLRRPPLLQLYALTVITMLGQFAVYSYISPILTGVAGYSDADVVTVLFIFGIAGILGTVLSSRFVDRYPSASLVLPLVLIAVSHIGLNYFAQDRIALLGLCVLWGAAMTSICMAFQTVLLNVASDAADVAASLYSGIFNIGIGGGAFIGSQVSESFGFAPVPFVGAALVSISIALVLVVWMRTGAAVLPMRNSRFSNDT